MNATQRDGPPRSRLTSASAKRSAPRDDAALRFFRDRQSAGWRQELLGSGLQIHELREALEREKQAHRESLERERRLEVFYLRDMQREREYHKNLMAIRYGLVDRLCDVFRHPRTAAFPASARVTTRANERIDEVVALSSSMEELTCVRVVVEARLHGARDVLPLISSFLISTSIPVDVAVTRCSLHMTAWLLANGSRPTARTAHAAVFTGSLAMVQTVFRHFKQDEIDPAVFVDIPIGHHQTIAEWLVREYPSQMAREWIRVSSSHGEFQDDQWIWYTQRLKRQWEWEDAVDEECWQRKRIRFR